MPDPAADTARAEAAKTGLSAAAERIRQSATWLLTSFAAVGVVLAGGLQLADLGKLSWDEPSRVVAALGGVTLAILGIAIAVGAASTVPTRSYVNLNWLVSHPDDPATQVVAGDQDLLAPYDTITALRNDTVRWSREAQRLYGEIDSAGPAGETEPQRAERRKKAIAAYSEANDKSKLASSITDSVLEVASFNRVRLGFEATRWFVLLGAVISAIGIVAFAWGANPPEPKDKIPGGEVLPKTPSEVAIIVGDNANQRAILASQLGDSCDLSNIAGIAVEVSGDTYKVVTLKTDKCKSQLLTIFPAVGKVVPRIVPETKPPATTAAAAE
jgi:hypothetical protein